MNERAFYGYSHGLGPLQFRPMRMDDIPAVCEIEEEAFATPWSEAAFHNELVHNQFARYVIMECGNTIAGYGGMWIITDEAHVTNVAVHHNFRGRKLGELLLREIQRTAVMLGARRMTLEVRQSNVVAQNLYTKLGFYSVGLRPGYYTDNNEDAVIMWADLPES